MQYREDVVKLFVDWCAKYDGNVYFVGNSNKGLPAYIYHTEYIDIDNSIALQDAYIDYLQNTFGEDSIFGEREYAIEFEINTPPVYVLLIDRKGVSMNYREDVIKLFQDWHKDNDTATILFKGYSEGFPEKIYVYNFKYRKDIIALQHSYIELLSRLLGEYAIYGETTYAVEFRLLCPKKLEDVTWKLEGTV